jgi:hypothetical protein
MTRVEQAEIDFNPWLVARAHTLFKRTTKRVMHLLKVHPQSLSLKPLCSATKGRRSSEFTWTNPVRADYHRHRRYYSGRERSEQVMAMMIALTSAEFIQNASAAA